MTSPTISSSVDAIHQLTLPLTRLRALLLRELADAAATRADNSIADVEHALARLDDGTYGTCEQCGAAIPVERLEAIPYARWCVKCPGQRTGLLG